MKRYASIAAAIILGVSFSLAQLKSQEQAHPSVASTLIRPTTGISGLLSWFNPENFMMRHSFSFQYFSGGGYGLSLATYTSSMFYRIADPLDVRFDVSLQGSPFGAYGFGEPGDFSKLFLSRAEVNYRPWENMHIQFLFRQGPFLGYDFSSPYYFRSTP